MGCMDLSVCQLHFACAYQACAYATAHTFLHGNLTENTLLLCDPCNGTKHGGRATGTDHVRLLLSDLLQQRFCHHGMQTRSAIIGTKNGFRSAHCKFLLEHHCRHAPETGNDSRPLPVNLSQCQHGRYADAAAH